MDRNICMAWRLMALDQASWVGAVMELHTFRQGAASCKGGWGSLRGVAPYRPESPRRGTKSGHSDPARPIPGQNPPLQPSRTLPASSRGSLNAMGGKPRSRSPQPLPDATLRSECARLRLRTAIERAPDSRSSRADRDPASARVGLGSESSARAANPGHPGHIYRPWHPPWRLPL